jgi:hypothetical protein
MRKEEQERGKANCLEEGTNASQIHENSSRVATNEPNEPKRFIIEAGVELVVLSTALGGKRRDVKDSTSHVGCSFYWYRQIEFEVWAHQKEKLLDTDKTTTTTCFVYSVPWYLVLLSRM